jgi:glycine cleavage system aminomethyltransferase T
MYRAQRAAGARFTDDAGWRVADVYTSTEEEVSRARGGVAIADVSACGKLGLRGEALEAAATKLTGRTPPPVGRVARERVNGTAVLACRRAADELLLLASAADHAAVAGVLGGAVATAGCVHVTDLTSAFAVVDVMGPALGTLLERLVTVDLAAVPPLGVVQGELARVHAIMVRLDEPALPLVRVLVPREAGDFVWHTLCDAGRGLGLAPIGAAAHTRLLAGG